MNGPAPVLSTNHAPGFCNLARKCTGKTPRVWIRCCRDFANWPVDGPGKYRQSGGNLGGIVGRWSGTDISACSAWRGNSILDNTAFTILNSWRNGNLVSYVFLQVYLFYFLQLKYLITKSATRRLVSIRIIALSNALEVMWFYIFFGKSLMTKYAFKIFFWQSLYS